MQVRPEEVQSHPLPWLPADITVQQSSSTGTGKQNNDPSPSTAAASLPSGSRSTGTSFLRRYERLM